MYIASPEVSWIRLLRIVISVFPPLPKSRPRYGDIITQKNKRLATQKPWTRGLYEGVIAADLISKQRLDQRNRIVLIVLDSTLEIAFKEYLVNDSGARYSDSKLLQLFGNRTQVHSEVKRFAKISDVDWGKIEHYYRMRCKLVHERATIAVDDKAIQDFRSLVERVLGKLYGLSFRKGS